MVRLIAMDMDGTLLGNQGKQISAENLLALRDAQAAGIMLAICSGRCPEDVSFYASDAQLNDIRVIALNGGWVLDRPHGRCMDASFMTEETTLRLLKLINGYESLICGWFRGDELVLSYEEGRRVDLGLSWGTHMNRAGGKIKVTYNMTDFDAMAKAGCSKLVCIAPEDASMLPEVRRAMEEALPELEVSSSWSNNLEIMPRGVNKGTALTKLADMLNIGMEDVMAIGDNENDLPMLEVAGYGVAMGNATPRVLKTCALHTKDNLHDGVAWAIRTWALEERA